MHLLPVCFTVIYITNNEIFVKHKSLASNQAGHAVCIKFNPKADIPQVENDRNYKQFKLHTAKQCLIKLQQVKQQDPH